LCRSRIFINSAPEYPEAPMIEAEIVVANIPFLSVMDKYTR